MRIMLKTYARRVAAGAVVSAALTAGSLGLTAAAAAAGTTADRAGGLPPVAASALECSEPRCLSGTDPAAAPRPGSGVTGRAGHGGVPARAAGGVRTAASVASAYPGTRTAINCPPPSSNISDPGNGGC
jgi:hypothetical protein